MPVEGLHSQAAMQVRQVAWYVREVVFKEGPTVHSAGAQQLHVCLQKSWICIASAGPTRTPLGSLTLICTWFLDLPHHAVEPVLGEVSTVPVRSCRSQRLIRLIWLRRLHHPHELHGGAAHLAGCQQAQAQRGPYLQGGPCPCELGHACVHTRVGMPDRDSGRIVSGFCRKPMDMLPGRLSTSASTMPTAPTRSVAPDRACSGRVEGRVRPPRAWPTPQEQGDRGRARMGVRVVV